jgi:hypothetical protein
LNIDDGRFEYGKLNEKLKKLLRVVLDLRQQRETARMVFAQMFAFDMAADGGVVDDDTIRQRVKTAFAAADAFQTEATAIVVRAEERLRADGTLDANSNLDTKLDKLN